MMPGRTLTDLQKELLRMRQANQQARRCGDEPPWTDDEIDKVQDGIREILRVDKAVS